MVVAARQLLEGDGIEAPRRRAAEPLVGERPSEPTVPSIDGEAGRGAGPACLALDPA